MLLIATPKDAASIVAEKRMVIFFQGLKMVRVSSLNGWYPQGPPQVHDHFLVEKPMVVGETTHHFRQPPNVSAQSGGDDWIPK